MNNIFSSYVSSSESSAKTLLIPGMLVGSNVESKHLPKNLAFLVEGGESGITLLSSYAEVSLCKSGNEVSCIEDVRKYEALPLVTLCRFRMVEDWEGDGAWSEVSLCLLLSPEALGTGLLTGKKNEK